MKSYFEIFPAALACAAAIFVSGCSTDKDSCSSGSCKGPSASFKGPVGLQLYSLRNQFSKDVPGTLAEAQKMGIKYAELAGTYNVPPAEFKAQLLAHNIQPISGHFGYDQFRDHLDDIVAQAKTLGLKYAGCAWIPHTGDFTLKDVQETAKVFNHAGQVLAENGIKFFYHTHGYEFQPYNDGTLFDELLAETDPKYVSYEMDIFWIVFPGQDPVKLLNKYGSRFELMHLKDMSKGLKTGSLAGGTDVTNDVTLGTGQIDLPATLRAAKKAGVKWYFIEDESPISEQQIPQSLTYLSQVKF